MQDRIQPTPSAQPTRRALRLMRTAAQLTMTLAKDGRHWCLVRDGTTAWRSTRLDDVEKHLDNEYMRAFGRE